MKRLLLAMLVVTGLTVGTVATALAAVSDQQAPVVVSDVSALATVQDQQDPGTVTAYSTFPDHENID